MRRDSLFFKLFQQFPSLLFEVLDTPPPNARDYRFDSVAVKEPSFTIDGVFLPPVSDPPGTVYFCEVQFQKDERLYERLFGESALYFYRNRERFSDWQAVVIYPSRRIEQRQTYPYRAWLNSEQMHRIYLDELGAIEALPMGVALMVLTTLDEQDAPQVARELLRRSQEESSGAVALPEAEEAKRRVMMEMISTIMIYKFTHLSRQEVEAMLDLRLEETRVYREAREEGEQIGEKREAANLIMRLLSRRLGQNLTEEVRERLLRLGVEPLEELGEALLDFTSLADLEAWLQSYRQQQQARIERIVPQLNRQLGQEMTEEVSDRFLLLSTQQLDELEGGLGNFTTLTDLEAWLQGYRC